MIINIADFLHKDFLVFCSQSIDIIKQFPKIGPQKLQALKEHNIKTIWDLLTLQSKAIHEIIPTIFNSKQEEIIAIKCKMTNLIRKTGKVKYIIEIECITDQKITSLQKQGKIQGKILFTSSKLPCEYKMGKEIIVFGKCSNRTFIHPKILPADKTHILHQYFCKPPLFDYTIQNIIKMILNLFQTTHPHTSLSYIKLFYAAHFGTKQQYEDYSQLLMRLEALAYHHAVFKTKTLEKHCIPFDKISDDLIAIYTQLVSTLTQCQQDTINNIINDFKQITPSKRMIFGDVGTGKTRITILAAIYAVSAGKQVLFLTPTTLLSNQVFDVFKKTFQNTDITITLLNNTIKKHNTNHTAQIIIGTHALFQDKHKFQDVGLIIIDEQHKFGVKQRYALVEKSNMQNAHLLSLSATPIPRTLMMVMQQYMQVSLLKTKPQPTDIKTYLLSKTQSSQLLAKLNPIIKSGRLVYWICPAVEDTEEGLNYMNATERYEKIKELYPEFHVQLLHGKMSKMEQDDVYKKVLDITCSQPVQILVATTIVEVGVDISHADIIIVEDAHRFGLAQLHQLRGRVGRAGTPGKCILIHPDFLSEVSKQRLYAMRDISDGFTLAEKDLQIRGHGNILGTTQTGFLDFKFLNITKDTELLIEIAAEHNKMLSTNIIELDLLMKQFFYVEGMESG